MLHYIKVFHDGGRYHIETSPLICTAKGNNLAELRWNIYLKDLKKKDIKNEKQKNRKQKKSVFKKMPPSCGAFQQHVKRADLQFYSH